MLSVKTLSISPPNIYATLVLIKIQQQRTQNPNKIGIEDYKTKYFKFDSHLRIRLVEDYGGSRARACVERFRGPIGREGQGSSAAIIKQRLFAVPRLILLKVLVYFSTQNCVRVAVN
jgi:hypothetical protein